jgi:hypothetical protein
MRGKWEAGNIEHAGNRIASFKPMQQNDDVQNKDIQ